MLRGMARLTTSGDLIAAGLSILFGLGIGAIIVAAMSPGTARTCAACIIGAVALGVLLNTWLGVFGRYRQLVAGKCPNPLCHGVVQPRELVGRGNVVCPTCKKTWPELAGMHFRATSRG